ncbi:MAG: hypothetical protein PVI26_03940 [Chitinispirillia bacterium]|jgi:Spy/CpxP family protein refolding chaperone
MKKLQLILVAVTITLLAGVSLAGGHFGKFKGMRGCGHGHSKYKKVMMFELIMEDLDLTEKQAEVIESALKNIRTIVKEKESNHSSKKESIVSAIKDNNLTEQTIIDFWRKHHEDAEVRVSEVAKEIVRINAVLTDKQREKVAERFESMHNREQHGLY